MTTASSGPKDDKSGVRYLPFWATLYPGVYCRGSDSPMWATGATKKVRDITRMALTEERTVSEENG